jgi:HD-GYP domain-containing protein (c-di-GMP phosphodiesterase class II)
MSDTATDAQHFNDAVARLGEKRSLVTSTAIYSAQGVKIIDKGVPVTAKLYERLVQHKTAAPLEESMEVESAVNGRALRAMAEQLIHEQPLFARMVAKPADRILLLDLLETVPLPAPVAFQLTVARDVHPDQYRYFVASALTAAWLGQRTLVPRYELSMLAAAGLLHDLGMLHIDPVLLDPKQAISRTQRRQLYSHPLVSALLLERHHEYPKELIRAVREHHEVLDGSGYPAGLAGAAISPWGRILSLAQVVAALAKAGRNHAELRLSVLLRTNRHRYDSALVNRLLPLLQRSDAQTAEADPADVTVADPVARLTAIDAALTAWPTALAQSAHLSAARQQGLTYIGERCADIRRTLVETGASPEQLVILDDGAASGLLAVELSLICHELAWQMRALQRQALRRWALGPDEAFPEVLQAWFGTVDAASADLIQT